MASSRSSRAIACRSCRAHAEGLRRRARDLDVERGCQLDRSGSSIARGNENNEHQPDGTYYLGEGSVDGYAVVNLNARYALTNRVQILGQVNNLFDRQYATGAQFGPAGFDANGIFVSRPLPAINGEFPIRHTTFLAAGSPLRGWLSLRVRF